MSKRPIFILLLLLASEMAFGQEPVRESAEEAEPFHRNSIGLAIGHSRISQGVVEEGIKWKILPSWSLFYNYRFNEKWGIGLHVDMIFEDFEVKRNLRSGSEDDNFILREKPIAPAVMGMYKPTKHSSFLIGVGIEYASEETFFLTRIEYEWSTEIGERWELVIPLSYDLRWDAYDMFTLGIGVSRSF